MLDVLVVEDETLIRLMVAEMVEELGHRVIAQVGTIKATEPLARTAQFDLTILDIHVGGDSTALHKRAASANLMAKLRELSGPVMGTATCL